MNNTTPTFAGIPISRSNIVYAIGHRSFTGEQILEAIDVCTGIAKAYALADPENGGSQQIHWEGLDQLAEQADAALGVHLQEVNDWAKRENGFEDPNFYVEHNGDQWQSVFPPFDAELSQLHATAQDAVAYIKEQFPDAEPIVRNPPTLAERKKADDTEGGACD